MRRKGFAPLPPGLEQVRERFERWRGTRTSSSPIPEKLWRAAARLCRHSSIHQISKALSLNHTALSEWVQSTAASRHPGKDPRPTFVEVHQPAPAGECVVEMENPRGAKLRISLRDWGDVDLAALGRAFWSGGS